jgi:hypothetical protein
MQLQSVWRLFYDHFLLSADEKESYERGSAVAVEYDQEQLERECVQALVGTSVHPAIV